MKKLAAKLEELVTRRSGGRIFHLFALVFTVRQFLGELRAVIAGRRSSLAEEPDAVLTRLRRNIHRLEKGMIMRPARLPFGRDYLQTTVDDFRGLAELGMVPQADAAWARDVLQHFFTLTADLELDWLREARTTFLPLAGSSTPALVPYRRLDAHAAEVSYSQLRDLSLRRRSVRWFDEQAVDPELVDQALSVASCAPSACNRQNLRVVLGYGSQQVEPILATAGGTKGFAHQVPCVAVLVGRLAGYRYAFDRHAVFVDGGLFAMSFILALETLGLSSCCINWPDQRSRYADLRRHVDIEESEQVIMMIAIGHADPEGLIPRSHKREVSHLRHVLAPGKETTR